MVGELSTKTDILKEIEFQDKIKAYHEGECWGREKDQLTQGKVKKTEGQGTGRDIK